MTSFLYEDDGNLAWLKLPSGRARSLGAPGVRNSTTLYETALGALAEEGGADPNLSASGSDGGCEVAGHAHGEFA